CARDSLTLDFW
nr:immunoglobulin heavy chain junction region [Macaca mulatta]MOW97837.1 immunoglobulin heavy chain junction region [Macaca mulatta]